MKEVSTHISRRALIGTAGIAGLASSISNNLFADHHAKENKVSLSVENTILFQGDSITDMKWGRNQNDRNHYLGHSYVYLIASRLGVDMAEAGFEFFNRGMSGHTVGNLKARWQKDAIDMKPDVLSILIGVNDVGRSGRRVST